MRYENYLLAALAAWGAIGCSDLDDTPSSLIVEPRVLAIRAEPPVVAPNGTVALSALIVDVAAEPSLASASFRACSPWEPVAEPQSDCGPESSIALAAPSGASGGESAVLDMNEMLAAFPPPSWYQPDAMDGEDPPDSEGNGQPPCTADYGFLDVPVIFTAEAGSENAARSSLVALKRVRVSEPGTVRKNPEIAEVTLGGQSGVTSFRPGEAYDIEVTIRPESLDETCLDDGQPGLEPVGVYVYTDAGELDEPGFYIEYTADGEELAGNVTWTAPLASEASAARLWIVAIDSDGGAGWQELRLTAE